MTYKNSYKGHTATKTLVVILLVSFFMLFSIGTISAWEWDNVKDYDEEKKTATITNALGFGENIATIKLDTPKNVYVIRGEDRKVAEFTINNHDDYFNVFNKMEFYDIKMNMEKFDRRFTYKYKSSLGFVDVKNYKDVCEELEFENKTKYKECYSKFIGTHKEERFEWVTLDTLKELPKGEITIGIFTDVYAGDKVEWIPTLFGVEIEEWAVWTEVLNVGLVSHWTLNESSGSAIDSHGSNDLSEVNCDQGQTGKIGTAYEFNGSNSWIKEASVSGLPFQDGLNTSFTVNSWIYWHGSGRPIMIWGDADDSPTFSFYVSATGKWQLLGTGINFNSALDVSQNVWEMGTFVYDKPNLNVSLYVNGTLRQSGAMTGADAVTLGSTWSTGVRYASNDYDFDGLIDEMSIWNRTLNADEVAQLWNEGEGINYTTEFFPIITLNSPIANSASTNQTTFFNGTASTTHGNRKLINVSFILNSAYNETNSSGFNNTFYTFPRTLDYGDYNWTMEVCDNISQCVNATTRNFTISKFIENSQTFNASSFETETETFTINITTITTPSSVELIYNGTAYAATITNTAGDDYNITRTIDIPTTAETKPWFFNFTIEGIKLSSSTQTQIINLTNFTFCSVGTPFINLSFKNETIAGQLVTAQINSDWVYWIGDGTVFKTTSFANTSENLDYQFCLVNINRTLATNVSMTYDNSISQQRNFEKVYSLTNTTTEQTLFLLPTSDGVFVTFQTVNNAEQIISDVASNVTKSGDLVASGVTDDAGLIQYFLDPDTTYVFSFSKEGFEVVTTTLKPTQNEFTIIMGGVTATVINDTTRGISYTISPLTSFLSNNTITEFNLTFSSTFWSLDIFGFVLKNSTEDVFNITTSTTNTGGFLSRTLDTGNNTDIIMEVFWTTNDNQTNITRIWKVLDTTDEGFSIKTFFDDLSTYLTSGLFGLTPFGLGIIIFLIIIITTGVISMKLGITNPAGLSIIVFAMVLFFDVGLGIMPNPLGAVPNFPTIFVGVIFLGLLLKEAIIR